MRILGKEISEKGIEIILIAIFVALLFADLGITLHNIFSLGLIEANPIPSLFANTPLNLSLFRGFGLCLFIGLYSLNRKREIRIKLMYIINPIVGFVVLWNVWQAIT